MMQITGTEFELYVSQTLWELSTLSPNSKLNWRLKINKYLLKKNFYKKGDASI